jgi:predicted GNAT family N-acyltransferase
LNSFNQVISHLDLLRLIPNLDTQESTNQTTMTTEFISMLPPPGASIAKYDCTRPSSDQDPSIPSTFCEAMSIREAVFVREQGVPLENELDSDDSRSFHWVVYASVGTSGGASPPPSTRRHRKNSSAGSGKGLMDEEGRRKSESTASRVAVGCIRLVPPPHPPHPKPSPQHQIGSNEAASLPSSARVSDPNSRQGVNSPAHVPDEPYIQLGRLATLPQFRSMGLSRLLIKAALEYVASHPNEISPPSSPAELEKAKLEGRPEAIPWKGLVLVHAQTQIESLWEKYGFKRDDQLGVWDEEGIDHVGMWRRIAVKDSVPGRVEAGRALS